MSAYKDTKQGTWYVSFRYIDWTGKKTQKLKRGFKTKKEALNYEKEFIRKTAADMKMEMGSFIEVYFEDKRKELKENSIRNKQHMIQQVQNSTNRGRERKVQAGIPGKEGNTGKLSVVEILADHFITGACHAPVNIRQEESR